MPICTTTGIIEIGCLMLMFLGMIGFFAQRIISGMSLGARAIQFISICLLLPTILILSLEKILSGETSAALIGGLAGYLLSDVGRYSPKEPSEKKDKQTNTDQQPTAKA